MLLLDRCVLIASGVALAACSKGESSSAASHVPAVQTPATPTQRSPAPTASAEWRVTYFGIGPLRAGSSVREAAAVLHASLDLPIGVDSAACHVLGWVGAPAGVRILVEHGRIGRVDVTSGTVSTEAGTRIGDTEARVLSLYPGRIKVEPHRYTAGHYLIVTPEAPADSAFRIIFETDGTRVIAYRSGRLPQVRYVEGCG